MIGPEDDTLDLTDDLASLREAPGPPCCCWFHRRADHAQQLTDGGRALARDLGRRLAGDTFGSLALRYGATAYALGAAGQALPQLPLAGPAAAAALTIAAWRAGRPVPPDPAELQADFLDALLDLIGDRPGIHLRELYDTLQAHPAGQHLDDARIRALLTHSGIPITQIRIGAVTGRSGIRAADIEALLPCQTPLAPSGDVDAGQRPPEGAVDRP
ncbi:hypothetical protein [Streptomyces antarcticus]|uniref:hypothetical protein n=1 Tax=Streptomyces antarcticus TaxID=2996458 RepID=UPI00226D70CB|nr:MULTISPECIES: hypothetical protein [unclassified Streptomyces]MCY0943553.1 hypothetical protein [Streptomyces sp. H34-AA3]MCZ4083538.1 hypothetical protein [Streptomyces sp. H34-S5]